MEKDSSTGLVSCAECHKKFVDIKQCPRCHGVNKKNIPEEDYVSSCRNTYYGRTIFFINKKQGIKAPGGTIYRGHNHRAPACQCSI